MSPLEPVPQPVAASLSLLAQTLQRTDNDLRQLVRWAVEARYRQRATSYLGLRFARLEAVELTDLPEVLRASDEQLYTDADWAEIANLGILLRAETIQLPPRQVFIALEASAVVDINDVRRARSRAELLSRAGLVVIPAVGGESATDGALDEARRVGVGVLTEGHVTHWPAMA